MNLIDLNDVIRIISLRRLDRYFIVVHVEFFLHLRIFSRIHPCFYTGNIDKILLIKILLIIVITFKRKSILPICIYASFLDYFAGQDNRYFFLWCVYKWTCFYTFSKEIRICRLNSAVLMLLTDHTPSLSFLVIYNFLASFIAPSKLKNFLPWTGIGLVPVSVYKIV